jgi:UDP-GlcNAc:undecaprenyl-phosphate GlcNAc-1-phosphate transferase
MGDSGSMLVGLMLSAAAVTATGGVDPQSFDSAASLLPLALPLLVPIAILFIPFIDLVMAVIRRSRAAVAVLAGQDAPAPPAAVDRPLAPPRRLVMYFWAAAALLRRRRAVDHRRPRPSCSSPSPCCWWSGVVVVLSPRARRAAREARAAELLAQKERSRPTTRPPGAARHASPRGPDRARAPTAAGRPVTAPRDAGRPWDISFLRSGRSPPPPSTAVAAPVVGLLGGWSGAVGCSSAPSS